MPGHRLRSTYSPVLYRMVSRAAGHAGESVAEFSKTATISRAAFVLVRFEPVMVESWHELNAAAARTVELTYGADGDGRDVPH